MKKEDKLRYIKELLTTASAWKYYDGYVVENFINEAKLKIVKIKDADSTYITDIDVFNKGKKAEGIIGDWKEQIVTTLKKLQFEIETEEENSPMKTLNIHCNKCHHTTKHGILKEHREVEHPEEMTDYGLLTFQLGTYVQVLKCVSCGEFAMKKYNIWSEDFPDFPETNVVILPKRRSASIKPIDHLKNVPLHIISLYEEVIEAYVNETNILCAGGIRAVLEAICIDKEIRGIKVMEMVKGTMKEVLKESLKAKIAGLHEQDFITQKHSDILVHHQFLGDKALHELEKPSNEELEIAIDIIGDTLNSIYELEIKGQKLKSGKENRK